MSTSTTNRSSTSRRRPRNRVLWMLAMGVLLFLGIQSVVIPSVFLFGNVTGEEFAPEGFSRREFAYLEIPLIRLQVSPIDRTTTTNQLENFVADKMLGSPATAKDQSEDVAEDDAKPESADAKGPAEPETRWDLVTASRSGTVYARGDAHILCQYLDAKLDDGESEWLQWSENNTERAEVAWPLVQQLATQRMYVFVPDVLERARQTENVDQLEQELSQLLADKFLQLAKAQQSQGRHEVAMHLIEDGLSYSDEHAELLAAKAESSAKLEP